MLESQSRQNWLFGLGYATYLFYAIFETILRSVSFAYMSFQCIEVVNINPYSVGIDVQKLFFEAKIMRTLSAILANILFMNLIWRLFTA